MTECLSVRFTVIVTAHLVKVTMIDCILADDLAAGYLCMCMCVFIYMGFGPEDEDLCHHAEQFLCLRVWFFQPLRSENTYNKL